MQTRQTSNEQDQSNLSPRAASDLTDITTSTVSTSIPPSRNESIKTVSQTTLRLFSQAHKSTALDPHLRSTISDIRFRFLSWAGNVGALAPEKASLDHRLREDLDILDALRSILQLLNEDLQQLIMPLHNIPEEEEECVWDNGELFEYRVDRDSVGVVGKGLVKPGLVSFTDAHAQTGPTDGNLGDDERVDRADCVGNDGFEIWDTGLENVPAESEIGDDEGEAGSRDEGESMGDADDSEDERFKQSLFENEDSDSNSSSSDTKMSISQLEAKDATIELAPAPQTRSRFCSTFDSDEFDSSSTESDSPKNNPFWGDKLKQVQQTIDQLSRFTTVLRKPASANENARVRAFMAKNTTEELEFLVFGKMDDRSKEHLLWWLSCFFPGLSEIVRERMLDSFVFRQMMLLYRERHQKKLEQGTLSRNRPDALVHQATAHPATLLSSASADPVDGLLVPSNTPGHSQTQRRSKATTLAPKKQRDSSTVLSSTIASSANPKRFPAYERSVIASTISRAGIERREGLGVPSLLLSPEYEDAVSRKAPEFKCSYCFKNIPLQEATEPRAS